MKNQTEKIAASVARKGPSLQTSLTSSCAGGVFVGEGK